MSSIVKDKFYTYTEPSPALGSVTISTQISDSGQSAEKVRYGYRASSTQKIMNNLPHWMEMRKNHLSVGQKLVHSWAHHLDDTIALYDEYRADQFLATADLYRDINLGISELSFGDEKVYKSEFSNLLYNSSFSINGPASRQCPDGWEVSRSDIDALQYNADYSLFGEYALDLNNISGGKECTLKQTRDITVSGGKLNLSIFVKTINSSGSTTSLAAPEDAGILLTVSYADGVTKNFGIGFPLNTNEKWARASFSVPIEKKVYRCEVIIINRLEKRYIIDLPMLEANSTASSWTPSIYDTAPFLFGTTRKITGAQVLYGNKVGQLTKKRELLEIESKEDFKDLLIPTRLEQIGTDTDPLNSFSLAFGRETTYGEETLPTKWIISNRGIQQKATSTPDYFGNTLLPADLRTDQYGELYLDTELIDTASITIEAVTVYSNWLIAVAKETYLGKTIRTLKFLKPTKLTYEDTILQSYADIKLPIDLSANSLIGIAEGSVTRVGICKNKPFCIFVDTDNFKRYYLQMKFDYIYADLRNRKVYCRENYTLNSSELQVI